MRTWKSIATKKQLAPPTKRKWFASMLLAAAQCNCFDLVKFIIGNQCNILGSDAFYQQDIDDALVEGHKHQDIVELLLAYASNAANNCTFEIAATNNCVKSVKVLIDHVSQETIDKALIIAVQNCHLKTVSFLIDYINDETILGQALIAAADKTDLIKPRSDRERTKKIETNFLEITKILDAQVTTIKYKEKALEKAAQANNKKIVSYFIKNYGKKISQQAKTRVYKLLAKSNNLANIKKIEPDIKDSLALEDAFFQAARNNGNKVLKHLVRKHSFDKESINEAFINAVKNGYLTIVKTLSNKVFDITIKKQAFIKAAKHCRFVNMIRYLSQYIDPKDDSDLINAAVVEAGKGYNEHVLTFLFKTYKNSISQEAINTAFLICIKRKKYCSERPTIRILLKKITKKTLHKALMFILKTIEKEDRYYCCWIVKKLLEEKPSQKILKKALLLAINKDFFEVSKALIKQSPDSVKEKACFLAVIKGLSASNKKTKGRYLELAKRLAKENYHLQILPQRSFKLEDALRILRKRSPKTVQKIVRWAKRHNQNGIIKELKDRAIIQNTPKRSQSLT